MLYIICFKGSHLFSTFVDCCMKKGVVISVLCALVCCASPVKEKGENVVYLQDGAVARRGDMYALADSGGYLQTGYVYEVLDPLAENVFLARSSGKYHLTDATGKCLSDKVYDTFDYCFNGFGIVSVEGRYGLVKITGEEVLPLEYLQVMVIAPELVAARMPGFVEVADLQGRLVARVEEEIGEVASDAARYIALYEQKLAGDMLYWNSILDQYDSLCTRCLRAKSIIDASGRLPEGEMGILVDRVEKMRAALQNAAGRMTAGQAARFKEIKERYGN